MPSGAVMETLFDSTLSSPLREISPCRGGVACFDGRREAQGNILFGSASGCRRVIPVAAMRLASSFSSLSQLLKHTRKGSYVREEGGGYFVMATENDGQNAYYALALGGSGRGKLVYYARPYEIRGSVPACVDLERSMGPLSA